MFWKKRLEVSGWTSNDNNGDDDDDDDDAGLEPINIKELLLL